MNLIIVESPTKSKTLQSFLGSKYRVLSSYGHIRDLPKGEFGVDVEHDFKPKYVIPTRARKTVTILKKEAEKAEIAILGTDEDREGEAIAFHLKEALELKKPQRIVFHEITKSAIEEALKNPRDIDVHLVNAQQARRILDRIVGYKLSPFLWKKVARGLSAGRVQSVAVRLVVDREKEIEQFKPQEYWSVEAELQQRRTDAEPKRRTDAETTFTAGLVKKDGKILDKFAIKDKKAADKIIKDLDGAEYKVAGVEKKEVKRNPLPPFTTSTLQQEAFRRFRFPAKMTMRLAQQLYETGHITYHRTDSLNLSGLALNTAKKFIVNNYGQNYYQFRQYKTRGRAQEAHEAIRPTYAEREPNKIQLEKNQLRLYDLIWRRFIASQMQQASFDSTTLEIVAENAVNRGPTSVDLTEVRPQYTFRTQGQTLRFEGFLKVYPIKYEETKLPQLEQNELLELLNLTPSQHFTQPPPRYTEASLIKMLEENGIGRPSTYAPIISTIQERNYVEKDGQKKFRPTEMGITVNDLLAEHFPKIVDLSFTADMEEDLDEIAEGKKQWVPVVREFYGPFDELLEQKYQQVSKKEFTETAVNKNCPECGGQIVIRLGRFGKFYACSNFPKCKHTEPLEKRGLNIQCPRCGKGNIVEKRTKTKRVFYGCNRYPECDFALWDKPAGEKCAECSSLMVQRREKIKCSNKECPKKLD